MKSFQHLVVTHSRVTDAYLIKWYWNLFLSIHFIDPNVFEPQFDAIKLLLSIPLMTQIINTSYVRQNT
jgi:hypothetical protein